MLQFEKDLFENLMKCIEASDKVMHQQLSGKDVSEIRNDLVLFLESMEEFMGLEGEKMGPYEKGQIVNLPHEIAKILIDDQKVERIE